MVRPTARLDQDATCEAVPEWAPRQDADRLSPVDQIEVAFKEVAAFVDDRIGVHADGSHIDPALVARQERDSPAAHALRGPEYDRVHARAAARADLIAWLGM
jgi:hypothetical protein